VLQIGQRSIRLAQSPKYSSTQGPGRGQFRIKLDCPFSTRQGLLVIAQRESHFTRSDQKRRVRGLQADGYLHMGQRLVCCTTVPQDLGKMMPRIGLVWGGLNRFLQEQFCLPPVTHFNGGHSFPRQLARGGHFLLRGCAATKRRAARQN
jgi:hypothetical protein